MRKIYNLIIIASWLILLPATTLPAHAVSDTTAPVYQPPTDTAGLQIVELLPHSTSCSPIDTSLLCNDYVKLFNGADTTVNLSDYRLRTSYGGLNGSSRNTFSLTGSLEPGQYMLINTRDDSSPLSLTQSGGYVWLEDAYGVQAYEPVVEYPDASANSKVGQAWALDGTDWQWTDSPQPDGPNDFPLLEITAPAVQATSSSSLKPCRSDQYRNPATNRCKLIKSATTTYKPCRPDQFRNPTTNRCKSIKSATTTYKPCASGKVRNPETHRCRSVLSATKTLKPCRADQERNPETNRCRKIQPKITPVSDIKTVSKTNDQRWYVVAAISIGASAYIFYEWRQELAAGKERLRAKLQLPGRQKAQNLLK